MNPAPLHIRLKEVEGKTTFLVYGHGQFIAEREELTPGDMCRLFADLYGMPITMDKVDGEAEQPTVVTSDHLEAEKTIVFDAIDYPSEMLEAAAKRLLSRAITMKLIEAAKMVELPSGPDTLQQAIRFLDNPQSPGNERMYAVQRGFNPRYAQFPAIIAWMPRSAAFDIELGPIELYEGEFGKDGQVKV